MKLSKTKVKIGGLMRCCTATLAEMPDRDLTDGEEIECKYEHKPTMVVRSGYIEWVGYERATALASGHGD